MTITITTAIITITKYFKYFILAFFISLFMPSFVFAEVSKYICGPEAYTSLNYYGNNITESHLYINSDESKDMLISLEIDLVKNMLVVNKRTALIILPSTPQENIIDAVGKSADGDMHIFISFNKESLILYLHSSGIDEKVRFSGKILGYICVKSKE